MKQAKLPIEWRSMMSQKLKFVNLQDLLKSSERSKLNIYLAKNQNVGENCQWVITLGTKPVFIRICMRSSEQNRGNILSLTGGKICSAWRHFSKSVRHGGIFHLDLSEYYNQTSDFTNKLFMTSSLRYSIPKRKGNWVLALWNHGMVVQNSI